MYGSSISLFVFFEMKLLCKNMVVSTQILLFRNFLLILLRLSVIWKKLRLFIWQI